METRLLDGKYIVATDGDGFVVKKRIDYQVQDKVTLEVVNKIRYENSFFSNYKNALIAVVRNAGEGCEDITAVLDRIKQLENEILGGRV